MSQPKCYSHCVRNGTLTKFNKLPFTSIVVDGDQEANHFHVSTNDVYNDTFGDLLNEIQYRCYLKCKAPDCETTYYVTKALPRPLYRRAVGVRLMAPREPTTNVANSPKMEFVEYVIFVLSSLGTWLGLSVFDLNKIARLVR